jgi:hypothetical protein
MTTRYEELSDAGRALTTEQVEAQVRVLARDPRFAALVALLERNHAAWAQAVSDQRICESHGKLAHAAGSLRALEVLRGQIAALVNRPAREKRAPMQNEE